eukprot:m.186526 g.186526  ORF g.186526 m.186526 type:complete len:1031 (-) comp32273_c0_seq1:139-3231(-)
MYWGDHHATITIGTDIYLVGLLGPQCNVGSCNGKTQVYDTLRDTYSAVPNFPSAQGSICAAQVNGIIYACGGLLHHSHIEEVGDNPTTCYKLDSSNHNQGWLRISNMLVGVDHASTEACNGKVYVFGGRHDGFNKPRVGIDIVQIYDVATDSWEFGDAMLIARGGTGVAEINGLLYLIGGETHIDDKWDTSQMVYPQTQIYNPSLDAWGAGPDLPTPVHGMGAVYHPGTKTMFAVGGGIKTGWSFSQNLQLLRVDPTAPTHVSITPTLPQPTPAPTTASPTPEAPSCQVVAPGKSRFISSKPVFCAPVEDYHYVRCCSDNTINENPFSSGKWEFVSGPECSVWTASEDMQAGAEHVGCRRTMSFVEADAYCTSVSARLCTIAEMLNECTAGAGCSISKQYMWTKEIPAPTPSVSTLQPTPTPTQPPATEAPTLSLTPSPTPTPTVAPFASPTQPAQPSPSPTVAPTLSPMPSSPTSTPTVVPSEAPTFATSKAPSALPTFAPISTPTTAPTAFVGGYELSATGCTGDAMITTFAECVAAAIELEAEADVIVNTGGNRFQKPLNCWHHQNKNYVAFNPDGRSDGYDEVKYASVCRKIPSTHMYDPTPDNWKWVQPLPLELKEAEGLTVDGKLWVFGGFEGDRYITMGKQTLSYDPLTDVWTRGADIPIEGGISHCAQTTDGSYIYLMGGMQMDPGTVWPNVYSVATVWRYDFRADTWARLPDMPQDRCGGGSGIVGNKLHAVSGGRSLPYNELFSDSADHWVLDLDNLDSPSSRWESLAPLTLGRNHLGSTVFEEKLYVFGGQLGTNEAHGNQDRAEVYDPETDTWKILASMPRGFGHLGPGVFASDYGIFIVGTTGNQPHVHETSLLFYDPARNTWSELEGMISFASQVSGLIGNTIYAQVGNRAYKGEIAAPQIYADEGNRLKLLRRAHQEEINETTNDNLVVGIATSIAMLAVITSMVAVYVHRQSKRTSSHHDTSTCEMECLEWDDEQGVMVNATAPATATATTEIHPHCDPEMNSSGFLVVDTTEL